MLHVFGYGDLPRKQSDNGTPMVAYDVSLPFITQERTTIVMLYGLESVLEISSLEIYMVGSAWAMKGMQGTICVGRSV